MSHTSKSQTSWSDFFSSTGSTAQTREAKPVELPPMSSEELREHQLRDRLKGPEATYELIDYIGSLSSGTGPTIVLSGGEGIFAVQLAECLCNGAVVVHHNSVVVEAMKARVSGSKSAVVNHLGDPERDPAILRRHEIRPAIGYRWCQLPQTAFKSETFGTVIIEQGHEFGIAAALAEAKRLLRKNGTVVLLGYLPFEAVARQKPLKDSATTKLINDVLEHGFEQALGAFVTPDERHLLDRYRSVSFPFNEVAVAASGNFRSRMFMRAAWNLFTLHHFIKGWPVVRRVKASGSIANIDLWNFFNALKNTWGSPRTRRVLNWPIAIRVGAKTSE